MKLNRSRHWPIAPSYKEARRQAIESSIKVQHKEVH